MKNLSASEVAAKWSQRANAATQDWVNGINATTTSPGQAAAAQVDVWANNTAAARQKWQAAVAGVDIGTWKARTVAKGQPRYGQGVSAGQDKYAAKIAKVLNVEKQIVGSLPPRGNRSQNIQRSIQFQEAMGQAADNGAFS